LHAQLPSYSPIGILCNYCCAQGTPEAVSSLPDALLACAPLGKFGQTLLHVAAAKDDAQAVKQLLSVSGVDVNAVDAVGRTPLGLTSKAC
jgi:ankyrin repeat protein